MQIDCLHTHVQGSISHNSHKVEETQVSLNIRRDKQNVVYIHIINIIQPQTEGNSNTFYNIGEDIMLSKISQSPKDQYMIPLT